MIQITKCNWSKLTSVCIIKLYYLVYIGNKSTDRWVVCVMVHENVKALCIFPSMSISAQIAVKLEKKVTKKITKGDTLSKWLL